MIPCICINDKEKPEEVCPTEWVKQGNEYNITHVYFHPMQGIQGCELKEVKLTQKSYPYEAYALSRFGVTPENMERLIQMMLDCSELNKVDIEKLLEESKLQEVLDL